MYVEIYFENIYDEAERCEFVCGNDIGIVGT